MGTEFEFIERIRERAAEAVEADLVLGIGDDAAVLREQAGRETVVTVDLFVEDVDFKLAYVVPKWLGHKALAVSLSDIAAMGARPKFALLTLGIPPALLSTAVSFWEEFFDGYFSLARQYGVVLVGGDISSTPERLVIDSMVLGACTSGKAVRRSGARAGDAVYVTGRIGAPAVGLKLLLDGARIGDEENSAQTAMRAHLRPAPRVAFGREVGAAGLASAMIDVSDGLTQDLNHLCEESRVAAILDFDQVPIAEEAVLIAGDPARRFSFAVRGGEDFELLLTAASSAEPALFELAVKYETPLARIGEIVALRENEPRLSIRRGIELQPLHPGGFDHFAV
jgi:thiamine-monophosphate kinase